MEVLTSPTDYKGTPASRKVNLTQPCPEGRSTRAEVQAGPATIRCNVSQASAAGGQGPIKGLAAGLGRQRESFAFFRLRPAGVSEEV